jgi:hypothetical protein
VWPHSPATILEKRKKFSEKKEGKNNTHLHNSQPRAHNDFLVHMGRWMERRQRKRGRVSERVGGVGNEEMFEFKHVWLTCHKFSLRPDSAWIDFFAKSISIPLFLCILNQIKSIKIYKYLGTYIR